MCVCSGAQLCLTFWFHQATLFTGFPRREYWSGLSFPSPRNLPDPGKGPTSVESTAPAGRLFITVATCAPPGGSDNEASACNAGSLGSVPGSGRSLKTAMATHSSILAWRIPWTEELLAGYSPWVCKESDMTEWLKHTQRAGQPLLHEGGPWFSDCCPVRRGAFGHRGLTQRKDGLGAADRGGGWRRAATGHGVPGVLSILQKSGEAGPILP